jgi:hypothetical protein
MSKSADIRAALAGGELPLSQLLEKTGMLSSKKLRDLCYYMKTRGEVEIDVGGEELVIKLAGRRSPPPKRKQNARKPRKSATMKRAPKAIKVRGPDLHDLALANLIAAGNDLRTAVKEQVEDIEADALLAGALSAHERAQNLFEAAQ